jgi:hypothetical protein
VTTAGIAWDKQQASQFLISEARGLSWRDCNDYPQKNSVPHT